MKHNTTIAKNKLLLSALIAASMTLTVTGCNQKEDARTNGEETHAEHEEHTDEHKEEHDAEHKDSHEGHDHEEGVAHVDKHVHGAAELNLIVNDSKLVIELHSPAMNVFGFEHKPSTDEQKAHVETQEKILNTANELFVINGGDCQLADSSIDMPFDEHEGEHHDDHADHADEHKHEGEEHDEHAHDEHSDEVHSDVKATYTYNCTTVAELSDITVEVFEKFAGFEQLNTSWVIGDKQGAETLNKTAHTINFKR